MKLHSIIGSSLLLSGLSFAAHAQVPDAIAAETDPAKKGLLIAEEGDRRNSGYVDSVSNMKMVLTNQHGDRAERTMRQKTLENPDPNDGDKSLIIFDEPRDVKGTVMLTFAHHLDPDDQWLYLPAIKKKKRISSSNKSGPFMGSEFAYEDLSHNEVQKYSYQFLRDEPCGVKGAEDRICHVVDRTPLYERSGYTKQTTWIDTEDYQLRQVEFFDRQGQHLKTLEVTDYYFIGERFWRPARFYVENHKTGKSTELIWTSIDLGVGLSDADFSKSRLDSIR